jgi:hypothetical protein
LRQFGDVLVANDSCYHGDQDQVNFGDAVGGSKLEYLEMNMEAVIRLIYR